jgi:hypothetical protein
MADPYAVLDVSPSSSPRTLRKAYKAAMRKAHPDRGGTSTQSIHVQKCYDSLTGDSKAVEPDSALTAWFAKMRRQQPARRVVDAMYEESVSGLTDLPTTDNHWRANPTAPGFSTAPGCSSTAGVSVDFDPSSVKW